MSRFLIIIEEGSSSYGAYSPDLPGCVAVGDTVEEVKENMRQAVAMHIQGMMEDNESVPVPHSTASYIDVSLPNSAA